MSSRFLSLVALLLICVSSACTATTLRVCADPDNLPFSNRKQQGFENKIAQLLALEVHARLSFVWARQRRGFVRSTLNANACDLIIGVPQQFRPVLTTAPYYRSTFVFAVRNDRHLNIRSFDDPVLRKLRIGVQVLEEEYAPPAQALGRRGLLANLVGFETVGAEAKKILDALVANKIDVAVLWGPVAGYYAKQQRVALDLTPVSPAFDPPALPMTFAISLGVRKKDKPLHDRLEQALARRKSEIEHILNRYGVPQLELQSTVASGAH
jgi:mxaJ protein